jgi:hypothetical protein
MSIATAQKTLYRTMHRDEDQLPSGFSHYIDRHAYAEKSVATINNNLSKYGKKHGFHAGFSVPNPDKSLKRETKEGTHDDMPEGVMTKAEAVQNDNGQMMYGFQAPSKEELADQAEDRKVRTRVDPFGAERGGFFSHQAGFGRNKYVMKQRQVNEQVDTDMGPSMVVEEENKKPSEKRRYDRDLYYNRSVNNI